MKLEMQVIERGASGGGEFGRRNKLDGGSEEEEKDKLGGNLSFYRRGRDAVSLPAPS
jgi:hypothetical protein